MTQLSPKDKLSMITGVIHEVEVGVNQLLDALRRDESLSNLAWQVEQIPNQLAEMISMTKEAYLKADDRTRDRTSQDTLARLRSIAKDLDAIADEVILTSSLPHKQSAPQTAGRLKELLRTSLLLGSPGTSRSLDR
jgi:hypothetical protein